MENKHVTEEGIYQADIAKERNETWPLVLERKGIKLEVQEVKNRGGNH